jgi:ABC-type phosphate transport system substrate-binding protein
MEKQSRAKSKSPAHSRSTRLSRVGRKNSKNHPGVRFDIASGGAGKGMNDILAGKVDIGMVSREIASEKKRKARTRWPLSKTQSSRW